MRKYFYPLLLVLLISNARSLQAQSGPDRNFGNNAVATFPLIADYNPIYLFEKINDRQMLACHTDFFLVQQRLLLSKLNIDSGEPDLGYGVKGSVNINQYYFEALKDKEYMNIRKVTDMLLLPDSSVILSLGSISYRFGYDIIVEGYYTKHLALMKLLKDGSIDKNFGQNGVVKMLNPFVDSSRSANSFTATSLTLSANNKILVGGFAGTIISNGNMQSRPFVLSLNQNGTVDTGFGVNGFFKFGEYIYGGYNTRGPVLGFLNIQAEPDGKIICSGKGPGFGETSTLPLVARLKPNGQLDSSFGGRGVGYATIDISPGFINTIAVPYYLDRSNDGSYYLCGEQKDTADYSFPIFIVKLKNDGTVDSSYGNQGIVTHTNNSDLSRNITGMYLDKTSNQLMLAGNGDSDLFQPGIIWGSFAFVMRHNANGQLDTSFDDDGDKWFLPSHRVRPQYIPETIIPGIIKDGSNYLFPASDEFTGMQRLVSLDSAGNWNSSFGTKGLKKYWLLGADNGYVSDMASAGPNNIYTLGGDNSSYGGKLRFGVKRMDSLGRQLPFSISIPQLASDTLYESSGVQSIAQVLKTKDEKNVNTVYYNNHWDEGLGNYTGDNGFFLYKTEPDGKPVPGFGNNGVVNILDIFNKWYNDTVLVSSYDGGNCVREDKNQNLYALAQVGGFSFEVSNILRLKTNGSPDSAFGNRGVVMMADSSYIDYYDVLKDGNMIVFNTKRYGYSDTIRQRVIKMRPDGSLVNSFGNAGSYYLTDTPTWMYDYRMRQMTVNETDSAIYLDIYDDRIAQRERHMVLALDLQGKPKQTTLGNGLLVKLESDSTVYKYLHTIKTDKYNNLLLFVVQIATNSSNQNLGSKQYIYSFRPDGTPNPHFGNNGVMDPDLYFPEFAALENFDYFKGIMVSPDGSVYIMVSPRDSYNKLSNTTNIIRLINYDNKLSNGPVSDKLVVYPNPTTGIVNFKTTEPVSYLSVFSIDGKLMMHHPSVSNNSVNMAGLAAGVYIFRFQVGNVTEVHKVVKQ